MQITGSNTFSGLRRPTTLGGGQESQRLVFLYPMIFDMSLMSYQNELRDLLTVDFIGQIKTSNVLNIVTNTSSIGTFGSGSNKINPAEMIRNNLDYVYADNSSPNIQYPSIDTSSTYIYQNKIDSFLNFIKNQLEHDPRYKKFRPIISSITLTENLINIPLIVGTKTLQIESEVLYWVLLIGILFNISLDSESNIRKIMNIYKNISPANILSVVHDDSMREKVLKTMNSISGIDNIYQKSNITGKTKLDILLKPKPLNPTRKDIYNYNLKNSNNALTNMKRYIGDRLSMQIAISFSKCVNRKLWDIETDHLSNDMNSLSTSAIGVIDNSTQKYQFQKAFGSFKSYISNSIIPILYGIENLLGPTPLNVSNQNNVSDFTYNIGDRMTGTYMSMSNHITNFIQGVTAAKSNMTVGGNLSSADFKKLETHVNDIFGICSSNASMSNRLTDTIHRLDQNSHLPVNFTENDLASFLDNLSISASKLNTHSQTIEEWISNILRDYPDILDDGTITASQANDVFKRSVKKIKDEFKDSVDTYINALYQKSYNEIQLVNRYKNFCSTICGYDYGKRNNPSMTVCQKQLSAILNEVSISTSQILYFFFIWNFISYLCEYMEDIDIDIKIQKKNVLDFPNYCLVVPFEIMEYLYNIINIKNLRNILSSNKIVDLPPREGFIADTNDVGKLIDVITARLKIPNIIVINRKRREAIYKFMYMSRYNKGSLDSLKSYISHQSQVLPGF